MMDAARSDVAHMPLKNLLGEYAAAYAHAAHVTMVVTPMIQK